MFNLIAQYIGYGTDTDVAECKNVQDPKFGVVEEGDWTVVDLTSIADVTSKRGNTTGTVSKVACASLMAVIHPSIYR